VRIEDARKEEILAGASKAVAEATGKPESYVMVTLQEADIAMGGEKCAAAFADVRGIGGISRETNGQISERLCKLLSDTLAIDGSKVYLTFTDVPASNWGWDGGTFG